MGGLFTRVFVHVGGNFRLHGNDVRNASSRWSTYHACLLGNYLNRPVYRFVYSGDGVSRLNEDIF